MKAKSLHFRVRNLFCIVSALIISMGVSHSQNLAYAGGTSTITDSRDGHIIKVIEIGSTTWMAENLNHEIRSGCWCYNNDPSDCEVYGKLYDWEAAQNACPEGGIFLVRRKCLNL